MAKNNMLLGYARGKVGDLVFQRRKGEQIVKARNRNPNNPRTWAQQMQRVRMYAPVAFYKLAVENFFRFAFENKKPNETDYNAFVRENLNTFNGPYFTRGQVQKGYVPIAPYKISNGSLGNLPNTLEVNAGDVTITIKLPTTAESVITVAETSQVLVDNGFKQGDLITAVAIIAPTQSLEPGSDDGQVDDVNFIYKQFTIDLNDTRVLSRVYNGDWVVDVKTEDGTSHMEMKANITTGDVRYMSICYAVIITRRTNGKIYASNTNLKLNDTANEYFKAFSSTEQLLNAAASYDATQSVLDPKKAKASKSTTIKEGNDGRTIIKETMSTEQSAFNCLPSSGQKLTPGPVEQNAPHNCPTCGCTAGEPEPQQSEPDTCGCEQETSSTRRSSRKTTKSNAYE